MQADLTCIVVLFLHDKGAAVGHYGTCVVDCRSLSAVWLFGSLAQQQHGILWWPFCMGTSCAYVKDRKYVFANRSCSNAYV